MMDFQGSSAKWLRNKEKIGFTAQVAIEGTSISIVLSDAPRKYAKAIRELAGELLSAGVREMAEAFAFPVAPEDAEEEGQRVREYLEERKLALLNLLLEEGCGPFRNTLAFEVSVLRARYELGTMQRGEDGWKRWDGACLTPAGWIFPDGKQEPSAFGNAMHP